VTGDEQSILVIKFLSKQTPDAANQSEMTKTSPEELNPRMQQALNIK
jgi:hypothetical protein